LVDDTSSPRSPATALYLFRWAGRRAGTASSRTLCGALRALVASACVGRRAGAGGSSLQRMSASRRRGARSRCNVSFLAARHDT